MGRKSNLNCPVCGVKKTEENTYLRQGGKYFQDVCKKCDSERGCERSRDSMSVEQLCDQIRKYERLVKLFKFTLKKKIKLNNREAREDKNKDH